MSYWNTLSSFSFILTYFLSRSKKAVYICGIFVHIFSILAWKGNYWDQCAFRKGTKGDIGKTSESNILRDTASNVSLHTHTLYNSYLSRLVCARSWEGKKKKKKVKCIYLIVNIASVCPVQFTYYLPSRTAPPSLYLDWTPSLRVGVLLCLVFKWPKRHGCCFSLRALQSNTGLRFIFLTKPQFWLWSVKLKISIILALWVFPGGDSCNYDSPFFMYTKKAEAMQEGKGKANTASFIWWMTSLLFAFICFIPFLQIQAFAQSYPTKSNKQKALMVLYTSPEVQQTWKFLACTEPRTLTMQYSLRKYFYFNSFSNLSSTR